MNADHQPVFGTLLTYGTFDLFHVGHLRLLERLSRRCVHLGVGISTEAFSWERGKRPVVSFEERCEIVAAIRYVSFVFPEASWKQKQNDVDKYGASAVAMGDDWSGSFDFLSCRVLYLRRTPGVSSSEIQKTIKRAVTEAVSQRVS